MGLPAAFGVGFAVAGGSPSDTEGLLHIQPPCRRGFGRRRLFLSVEPLQPTDRGREVAGAAIMALREGFVAAADQPVAAALAAAFAAANAAVREENRLRPSDGADRRVFVGATAMVLEGRELTVAQVPPSQAAIVQDGQVYAFPDFSSWAPRFQPAFERIGPDAEPLGRAEQATVDLFRTVASRGDLLFLCASAIPIAMSRHDAMVTSEWDSTGILADLDAALRPGDPVLVIDHLGDVIERHDLDDAHAACVTVGRLHCLDPRIVRETAARIGLAWGVNRPTARPMVLSRGRASRGRRRSPRRVQASGASDRDFPDPAGGATDSAVDRALSVRREPPNWLTASRSSRAHPWAPLRHHDHAPARVVDEAPSPQLTSAWWSDESVDRATEGVRIADDSHLPGRVIPISLTARDFSPSLPPVPLLEVWRHAATAARARANAAAARPMDDGPRPPGFRERVQVAAMTLTERVAPPRRERPPARSVRVAPGVLSMQRHRNGIDLGISSDWRSRLPRASFGPLPRPLLITILAVLVVMTTAGYVREFVLPDRAAAEVERHLAAVDAHVAAAERTGNATIVRRELTAATDALALAVDAGASAEAIETAQRRVGTARDRAGGIIRLVAGERLGGLPEAPVGGYRLLQGGGEVYLVGGALFRFDQDGRRLVRVLAPGDRLGQTVVQPVYHASFDDGALVVSDGGAAYSRDLAGTWDVRGLSPVELAAESLATAPSVGFDGHLYVLDSGGGSIIKFGAGPPDAPPLDWTGGTEREDLQSAQDLVVDGNIYVLLDDGRVLRFYRGALDRTFDPPEGTELRRPTALAPSGDGKALFIVDAGSATTPGRVVRLDLTTGEYRELVAEPIDGVSPLSGITDVLVDEAAGSVHVVTADTLWRFALLR